ncbi:GIY-YIG nuclease family protein [Neisseria weaveri]|uniref:GIY-YIG nuclease family protein n=1 Tax=Neisseria weaveri TaxID=28091 RepID=UPI0002230745|nr:GIY-YIG nuclease family protein [Neisseria weaveri]EGV37307.1 hypothetical protein l13_04190 [Neisseria weaveri ATCC 51223]
MSLADLLAQYGLPVFPEVQTDGGWCVYLILCGNGSLYCGISNRPAERFASHAAGKGAKFTRMHKPVEMRLLYRGLCRSQAAVLEPSVKKLKPCQKKQLWAFAAQAATLEVV